jgi:predicted ribosome quality control (RQC) complex YloA/Tae2 family protein
MKKELSSLEIAYLIKEFQSLISSKINNSFHPEKEEIILDLFIPNKGKKILRILPKFIYLTDEKRTQEKPSGFCAALRKYLHNARLRKITQIDSERIIEFLFETKENKFFLIVELFGNGNALLCRENYEIINLLDSHTWKDRTLKPKLKYKTPPKKVNFFNITEKTLKQSLTDQPLVKNLASKLGFGGVYAEEICLLSKIDKNKTTLTKEELTTLVKTIKTITNKEIKPTIVQEDDTIIDLTPFKLEFYKEKTNKTGKTYNHILNSSLTIMLNSQIETEKTKEYQTKIKKINNIIEKQKEKAKEIEDKIKAVEKKAETIYSNHTLIKEVIKEIKKAKDKYSWAEIKVKLKDHKVVKELDPKNKKLILELN